ncbi:MAG: copper(I)-binding protein [Alteromonadaceae bacterium]|jgi:copper(I)-binding protein
MFRNRLIHCALFFALSLAPAVWAQDITITQVFVREMLPGSKVTAGYFTLTNNTHKPVTLQSVTSPLSSRIEIHQHVMKNGLMKMQQVNDAIVIKPDDTLQFQPGGLHLMVFHPTTKIIKSLAFELTFSFKQAQTLIVPGKVVSVLDDPQLTSKHSHHH